jgi:ubiquinone/menaquinone biosynthesis C-methylase UbiE
MKLRSKLQGMYWWMRTRIVPTLKGSQDIYEYILKDLVKPNLSWLDIGCGHQILAEWRADAEKELIPTGGITVGLDYDLPSLMNHRSISLRVRGDIVKLPFRDSSFDLVTANMVVEHLENPAEQFAEVARILKPGGTFLFHTPNARGYFSLLRRLVPNSFARRLASLLDGRDVADVFPVQYKANTTTRIEDLAQEAQLDVSKTKMVVSEAVTQVLPPLAFFELLYIRALMTEPLRPYRTNIIALLTKRCGDGRLAETPLTSGVISDGHLAKHHETLPSGS